MEVLKMMHEQLETPGENEILDTPGENEEIIETPDNVADTLTSKQLEAKVEKLVNEKVELALDAHDNEEDEEDEYEEENKSLGLFPTLLIGGIVLVAAASIFLKNRPISHPNEAETENKG